MPQLELTIASGIDDAEVRTNAVSTNASPAPPIGLALGVRAYQALLFRGAAALKGSTIDSAVLRVTPANGNFANGLFTKISAEAADHPEPLANGTSLAIYLAIARTSAFVDFDPTGSPPWPLNTPIDSPDLSAVVQEVIDRPGFVDRIHILWDDDNSQTAFGQFLVWHYDGVPASAPKLIVAYSVPPPKFPGGGIVRRGGYVGDVRLAGHRGKLWLGGATGKLQN